MKKQVVYFYLGKQFSAELHVYISIIFFLEGITSPRVIDALQNVRSMSGHSCWQKAVTDKPPEQV
jgi:hypothetical protein